MGFIGTAMFWVWVFVAALGAAASSLLVVPAT